MTFDVKKKFLSVISVLNTMCAICILCVDFIKPTLVVVLLDFLAVMMAFLPYIYIRTAKKMKHLFWVILPFAISGFLSTSLTGFILSAIGLVVSFISAKEEYFRFNMGIRANVCEEPEFAVSVGGGLVAGNEKLLARLRINRR